MSFSILCTVRDDVTKRSELSRNQYLKNLDILAKRPKSTGISCSNVAHATASADEKSKRLMLSPKRLNLGIVNAYNDMLSAHKPYENYPELIRRSCAEQSATAQVAGGVPAMCDGITQGREGMSLSLFSRDIIAMSTAVALSHDVFDGTIMLGTCDKIVPGLLIGALQFGHLPSIFIPAGPMISGFSNIEKKRIRQLYIENKISTEELLNVEMQAYHSPGTCTFYGTSNSNQMLLEIMGLHRPNHAFFNPTDKLKPYLISDSVQQLISNVKQQYLGLGYLITVETIINALVGLVATGGSTNHTIHWLAVAQAAGFKLFWEDIVKISNCIPQISQVYPNGPYDINDFQEAGGPAMVIRYLLDAKLLFEDVHTVNGFGLANQCVTPVGLEQQKIKYIPVTTTKNDKVIKSCYNPFKPHGGISLVQGNLGRAIVKTSALNDDELSIKAPAKIFHSQYELIEAHRNNELNYSMVAVVKQQGAECNGMPELHKLMPILDSIKSKGYKVALITDGRLSGASGQVLAALHLVPETKIDTPINKIVDGDIIHIDCQQGILAIDIDDEAFKNRLGSPLKPEEAGFSKELFKKLRTIIGPADEGATIW